MKIQIKLYMKKITFLSVTTCLLVLSHAKIVQAQWVDDVFKNNPICTIAGNQIRPDLVTDGRGGAIIMWEDYRKAKPNIYAQRIDVDGLIKWADNGIAVCLKDSAQRNAQVVSDGKGGAIIAWEDYRSGNADIYIQLIDSLGIAKWTAGGVALSTGSNYQITPKITTDGNGGAIITWVDSLTMGGTTDIYAQRVDASGTIKWTQNGVAVCKSANKQRLPVITTDGKGGAIIAWEDYRIDPASSRIYAQRIDMDGIAKWTVDGIQITTINKFQRKPVICSNPAGGAIVTWEYDGFGNNIDLATQKIDDSGALQWGNYPDFNNKQDVPLLVPFDQSENQTSPTLVNDSKGGAFIAFLNFKDNPLAANLFLHHQYNVSIEKSPGFFAGFENGPLYKDNEKQQFVSMTLDEKNRPIVTWHEIDLLNNTSYDIYANKIDSSFSPYIQAFWGKAGAPVCLGGPNQMFPKIINSFNGSSIITWQQDDNNDNNIYASKIGARGLLVSPGDDGSNTFKDPGSNPNPSGIEEALASAYQLSQNYPNPFSSNTVIKFSLLNAGLVKLKVYDMIGREVATLTDEFKQAGNYSVNFNATTLQAGVYFYKLQSGNYTCSKKMLLMK